MTTELYLTFVAATIMLITLPGPNVALIVANSIAHGRRYGLATVIGTTSAMIPQLALTIAGMTGALTLAAQLFDYLRWAGVIYLAYLGIRAWRAPVVDLSKVKPEVKSIYSIILRGFLVSATNPKTLLFYGAFFPQFLTREADVVPQLMLLSLTFLVLAATLDCCWALLAGRLRPLLQTRGRLRNRLTGSFYTAAAIGLASAKRTS